MGTISETSSNTIQSDSLRVAVSRDGSIVKTDSSTSKQAALCMTSGLEMRTCDASESTPITLAMKTSVGRPWAMAVTFSGVLSFFHCSNFENASEEEAIFFCSLFFHLQAKAKTLARDSGGRCDLAHRALLAAMQGATQ